MRRRGLSEQLRLDCRYERHVENAGWISGAPTPMNIIDEFLRIDFGIADENGSLSFEAKFHRS